MVLVRRSARLGSRIPVLSRCRGSPVIDREGQHDAISTPDDVMQCGEGGTIEDLVVVEGRKSVLGQVYHLRPMPLTPEELPARER
jgi:hypothetical protein